MLKRVFIRNLKPNPFRNLSQYPIQREKIDALKESIGSTGFWGTIVGRPVGKGDIEIAFGHHRMKALQEALGPDAEIEIIVRDLTNEQMLKMMARENMEEWGSSAWVELETVRATIKAYGDGKVELPLVPEKTKASTLRYDNKRSRDHNDSLMRPYTVGTVAEFLGWISKETKRPNYACTTAFKAIDMIDQGLLDESKIAGMKRAQLSHLIDAQLSIHESEMRMAEQNRIEAERAKERASEATAPIEKRRLETQAKIFNKQAEEYKVAAKEKARGFGEDGVTKYREGGGIRDIDKLRDERRTVVPQPVKVIDVDDLADKLCGRLESIGKDDEISEDVSFLKQNKRDLSGRAASGLCQSFDVLIDRLERMRNAFK